MPGGDAPKKPSNSRGTKLLARATGAAPAKQVSTGAAATLSGFVRPRIQSAADLVIVP